MTNFQDKITETVKEMTEKQEAFAATSQEGLNKATEVFQKMADFQMQVAAETVDAIIAQAKLMSQPGNPVEFVEKQVALMSEGFQKASARATELSDLVTASATEMGEIFAKPVKG